MTPEERLTKLETQVEHIDEMVKDIQKNVTNHIPTSIEVLRQDLQDFKLQQSKLFVAILTSLLLTLAGVIISILIQLKPDIRRASGKIFILDSESAVS